MKFKPTTKLFSLGLAALSFAASFTPNARAFTYTDGDLLLVFRKSTFNDVEFNLGTVSNYLGKANGTVLTVTNFRLSAVNANFNNNLNGVTISLVAATTPTDVLRRAWVTDPDANSTRLDITGSRQSAIWSKVNGVGSQAVNADSSFTNEYIISPSESSAYSYIVSTAGGNDPATLSGAVLFSVDGTVPAALRFFELKVSGVNPKPDAAQVGTFNITVGGVLTFTAGTNGGGGGSAPVISAHPTNVTVFAGGPAAFNVSATGATGYQWQFNSANIPGATASSYSLTAHSTNAGGYRAIVSNGSGSVTSTVAALTVNLPAAASLGSVSLAPGGPFQLKLTGTAAAYYEIQRNTNLNFTNWTTVAFITNSGGMTVFGDNSATNRPQQFYRAIAR